MHATRGFVSKVIEYGKCGMYTSAYVCTISLNGFVHQIPFPGRHSIIVTVTVKDQSTIDALVGAQPQ